MRAAGPERFDVATSTVLSIGCVGTTRTSHDLGAQATLTVWILDGSFGENVMIVVRGSDRREDHRTHHSPDGFLAERKKNTSHDGLLIASKDFLHIFMDTTNDVLRHRRTQSVFDFSSLT